MTIEGCVSSPSTSCALVSLSFLARLAEDIFLAFRAISVVAGSELLLELELKLELLIPSKELALATAGTGMGMLNYKYLSHFRKIGC